MFRINLHSWDLSNKCFQGNYWHFSWHSLIVSLRSDRNLRVRGSYVADLTLLFEKHLNMSIPVVCHYSAIRLLYIWMSVGGSNGKCHLCLLVLPVTWNLCRQPGNCDNILSAASLSSWAFGQSVNISDWAKTLLSSVTKRSKWRWRRTLSNTDFSRVDFSLV